MLQMNLDQMNALVGMAFSDQDRAMILGGLVLGCNAGTLPEHCSQLVHDAYIIGRGWRDEAQAFIDTKSAAGKASARARKLKLGDANPRTNREQNVNSVHGNPEQSVNQPTTYNLPNKNIAINQGLDASLDAVPASLVAKKTKKPKSSVAANPLTIPPELLSSMEALIKSWPKKTTRGGKTVSVEMLSVDRLWKYIRKNTPQESPEEMVKIGLAYVGSLAKTDGIPEYVIGMVNFYGQKQRWEEKAYLLDQAPEPTVEYRRITE